MTGSVDDRLRARLAALADAVPADPARPTPAGSTSRPGRAPVRSMALPGGLGLAALLVVLVAGLAWVSGRPPAASPGSSVVGVSTAGDFQLAIRADRSSYAVDAPITVSASLVYHGSQPSITVMTGGSLVTFGVEQLDGAHHVVEPAIDDSCRQQTLQRDQPVDVPFSKSGAFSDADPDASFKASYLADPVLRLPAGTWRINAETSFSETTCGPGLSMRASVVVTVGPPTNVPGTLAPSPTLITGETPTANPTATLSPSGATQLSVSSVAFWGEQDGLVSTSHLRPDGSGNGEVLITHDGGRSWESMLTTPAPAYEVWTSGSRAAWALTGCGRDGDPTCRRLYRTTDGGATWDSTMTDVTWASFTDNESGWGIVDSGPVKMVVVLRRTDDGGTTWQDVPSPCDSASIGGLRVIAFGTRSSGLAVCADTLGAGGEFHSVLATTDGGIDWTVRASTGTDTTQAIGTIPYGGYIGGIVVAPDGTAWMTGGRMVPLVSTNDGGTWSGLSLGDPDANLVGAAWPIDANLGVALMWAADRQATLLEVTADGGRTWTERSAWSIDEP